MRYLMYTFETSRPILIETISCGNGEFRTVFRIVPHCNNPPCRLKNGRGEGGKNLCIHGTTFTSFFSCTATAGLLLLLLPFFSRPWLNVCLKTSFGGKITYLCLVREGKLLLLHLPAIDTLPSPKKTSSNLFFTCRPTEGGILNEHSAHASPLFLHISSSSLLPPPPLSSVAFRSPHSADVHEGRFPNI